MKATLQIEADTEDKLRLLIRVAEEMGIEVKSNLLVDPCTAICESSLAKDWDSPEDARWDKYLSMK